MKEEEFKGLMQRYVSSTARGKKSDLAKLTDEIAEAAAYEARKKEKAKRNAARALVVAAIALVLTLSIAIPLALRNEYGGSGMPVDVTQNKSDYTETEVGLPGETDQSDAPHKFYCADDDLLFDYFVDDAEGTFAANGLNVMLPSSEGLGALYGLITLKASGENIGASASVVLFDELVNEAEIKVFVGEYYWSAVASYENFDNSVEWRGREVKYYAESVGEYNYMVYAYFAVEDARYYITVSCACESDIPSLLEHIF